ncbi:AMIN-like domain-containing (lipo)protein [Cumulibacter manganitolerans]|uniref:AMIN-like domain-containing (lipo)protein n=1 Tax=Cumulibacter manganitolerans TaxID=1884992 RepID=UPI001297D4F9|nr:hypothetical protein [Cumulibacter manganitolerans]
MSSNVVRRSVSAAAAFGLAAGVLAGCASEPSGTPGASGSASSASRTSSSSAPATSGSQGSAAATSGTAAKSSSTDASASPQGSDAPFVADTSPDTATATTDAALVLTAVRSGVQPGFDRVVLEFTGPGKPGWEAKYVDAASRQGSGAAISPGGSAIISIVLTGTTIPQPGQATVPGGPIATSGTTAIKGVFNDGTFEGMTQVVLGIDGKKPFRVFYVANPSRVVIDVQR